MKLSNYPSQTFRPDPKYRRLDSQGHWADTFFSNATVDEIQAHIAEYSNGEQFEIRQMTTEEMTKHPEIIDVIKFLKDTYGEV